MTVYYSEKFVRELIRQSEALIALTKELISSEVNEAPQTPTKGE